MISFLLGTGAPMMQACLGFNHKTGMPSVGLFAQTLLLAAKSKTLFQFCVESQKNQKKCSVNATRQICSFFALQKQEIQFTLLSGFFFESCLPT